MIDILFVDDDEDDALFIKDSIKGFETKHNLVWLKNGAELIDYLGHNSKPHIIILDLNMPIMSGQEALSIIKSNPDLKSIPVVIFTTSNEIFSEKECIIMGANGCYLKPSHYGDYKNILREILGIHFKG